MLIKCIRSTGCVRLFDPYEHGRREGNTILAKVNSDIATFHLGNSWELQHRLVVWVLLDRCLGLTDLV